MTRSPSKIRFKAKLLQPAAPAKTDSWTFLILPKEASAKLPSRGMRAIEGTLNGVPFQATLEPDGQKSHWLKVDRKMRDAAGATAGDMVTLEISPAAVEPEPEVPEDLRKALAAAPPAAGLVVRHNAYRAQGLDPLDHIRQAAGDSRTPGRECLLDARSREATRLLLRSVGIL